MQANVMTCREAVCQGAFGHPENQVHDEFVGKLLCYVQPVINTEHAHIFQRMFNGNAVGFRRSCNHVSCITGENWSQCGASCVSFNSLLCKVACSWACSSQTVKQCCRRGVTRNSDASKNSPIAPRASPRQLSSPLIVFSLDFGLPSPWNSQRPC